MITGCISTSCPWSKLIDKMMRRLHISDFASLAMQGGINGPDQVQSLKTMGQYKHHHSITIGLMLGLLKELILPKNRKCTWIGLDHRHIWGLVSANMRSGPRAWEIDHIFHDTKRDNTILELVDNIVAELAHFGATRVFLRLTEPSPLVRRATQSGFLIYKFDKFLNMINFYHIL